MPKDETSMRLIFVRHGETIENRNRIFQGQRDGTLSELGIEQAKKLALKLKGTHIDAIYSSDLGRARDTAKEIAKYHSGAPIEFTKALRERRYGPFEGKDYAEIGFDWKDRWALVHEGVETPEQVRTRVSGFLEETERKHRGQVVLWVGHGGSAEAVLSIVTGTPMAEITQKVEIANTTVTVFEIREDKLYKVEMLNDVKL